MTNIDTNAESRAWAAARNVPEDVMTEREFLWGANPPVRHIDDIPGYREHTEAAVARIAHNSIVLLELKEALADLFNDDSPVDLSMRLTAARRAWQAWKETT
jgi:hypothetical protein